MLRNLLISLVGAPLFLPLAFAYIGAMVVAAIGILRSLVENQGPSTRS
jgi:hypothetical protein